MKRIRNRARNIRKKTAKPKKPLEFSKTRQATGGPLPEAGLRTRPKYTPQIGLPPNEKLRQFADEIYGAIEMPSSSRKK